MQIKNLTYNIKDKNIFVEKFDKWTRNQFERLVFYRIILFHKLITPTPWLK